jgi:hypothetical protein
MRLRLAFVVVVVAMLGLVASAQARDWLAPVVLGAGEDHGGVQALPLPLGQTLALYTRTYSDPFSNEIVARDAAFGSAFGSDQVVASGSQWYLSVATDAAGEAIAVWYDSAAQAVDVAIRAAGAVGFAAPVVLYSASSDFGLSIPRLAVNARGDAAVLLQGDSGGIRHVQLSYRPAGGAFGGPEDVAALPAGGSMQIPRDVAVDPQGRVVAAYLIDDASHLHGVAAVAARDADGTWQQPQTLGEAFDGWSARLPRVGIDAAGRSVVVWQEGTGSAEIKTLKAAFRGAPGGSFTAAQDTGLTVVDGWPVALAVSDWGEVIVLTVSPAGTAPLVGLAGSTALGRFDAPQTLGTDFNSDGWALAMNARGDAVLAYVSGTGIAVRRRSPFGPFTASEQVAPLSGAPGWPTVTSAGVDQFGNAVVAWFDPSTSPLRTSVARDAPLLDRADPVTPPAPLSLTPLWPPPARVSGPTNPGVDARPRTVAPQRTVFRLLSVPNRGRVKSLSASVGCRAACNLKLTGLLTRSGGGRWAFKAARGALDRAGNVRLKFAVTHRARLALATVHHRRFTLRGELVVRSATGLTRLTASQTFTR